MEAKEKTISENFQANLNKLLLENHLSMRTLSLDIGKSESYIQKVMDNKISPPLDTLVAIAEYFHIPFAALFSQGTDSMEIQIINDKLRQLPTDTLLLLLQIAEKLLNSSNDQKTL